MQWFSTHQIIWMDLKHTLPGPISELNSTLESALLTSSPGDDDTVGLGLHYRNQPGELLGQRLDTQWQPKALTQLHLLRNCLISGQVETLKVWYAGTIITHSDKAHQEVDLST